MVSVIYPGSATPSLRSSLYSLPLCGFAPGSYISASAIAPFRNGHGSKSPVRAPREFSDSSGNHLASG